MTEDKEFSRFMWPVLLIGFTTYTIDVMIHHGYNGFIYDVALASGWGTQVFADLCIGLFVALSFIVTDARKKGITAWPFILGTLCLGSIGVLGYMSYRGLRTKRKTPTTA